MQKVSKLIPDPTIEKYRACGMKTPVGRCTGKTTGAALGLIGEAMQNPETPVASRSIRFKERREELKVAAGIVSKLNLKFFEFGRESLTYKPYKEVV